MLCRRWLVAACPTWQAEGALVKRCEGPVAVSALCVHAALQMHLADHACTLPSSIICKCPAVHVSSEGQATARHVAIPGI
jgi:hypothetical protein